jgi:hypothetical protein
MESSRKILWYLALCGLVCAVVTLSSSGSRATILGFQFFSPKDGESYRTGQVMTISFHLYSSNPSVDELRHIYFYIYERYDDHGSYIALSDFNDVADVIVEDWVWDSSGYYRALVEERVNVPKTIFAEHTSNCKAAVTFDGPIEELTLSMHTDGWFTVHFIPKTYWSQLPHPIIPTSEFPLKTDFDRNGEHSVATPYPNPFNPNTTVCFSVREHANVSLAIYDVNGKVIKTFYNNVSMSPGDYTENWNGRNEAGIEVVSGVYFLRFNAGNYSDIQKMILLR